MSFISTMRNRLQGWSIASLQGFQLATLAGDARRFVRACHGPEAQQLRWIRDCIRSNQSSNFGRQHRFEKIRDIPSYQREIPIRRYADFAPWIERSAAGTPQELTRDPVEDFRASYGAARQPKVIPYTRGLVRDFTRADAPWLLDLFFNRRGLWGRRAFCSFSRAPNNSAAIGTVGTGFFHPGLARHATLPNPPMAQLLRSDARPKSARDGWRQDQWLHETSLALLRAPQLGLISIQHPLALEMVLEYIESKLPSLCEGLSPRRREQLQAFAGRPIHASMLWPKLRLISCWADGFAHPFVQSLQERCPGIEIQGKGLRATEGVVSVPLTAARHPVAAVTSHFLEFLDLEHPKKTPLLVHELQAGARYEPVLTTRGGLYRYALGDSVQCEGYYRSVPMLSFQGRIDQRSDLAGEALDAAFVQRAISRACKSTGIQTIFNLLSPAPSTLPHYILFVESRSRNHGLCESLRNAMERELMRSTRYATAVQRGKLAPLQVRLVRHGWRRYREQYQKLGRPDPEIHPSCLAPEFFWSEVFTRPQGSSLKGAKIIQWPSKATKNKAKPAPETRRPPRSAS